MKTLVCVGLFVAAVLSAPSAHADDASYLRFLQDDTYLISHFTPQRLLAEGYKVCDAFHAGMTQAAVRQMVATDLGVSVTGAAMDVSAAAQVGLGC